MRGRLGAVAWWQWTISRVHHGLLAICAYKVPNTLTACVASSFIAASNYTCPLAANHFACCPCRMLHPLVATRVPASGVLHDARLAHPTHGARDCHTASAAATECWWPGRAGGGGRHGRPDGGAKQTPCCRPRAQVCSTGAICGYVCGCVLFVCCCYVSYLSCLCSWMCHTLLSCVASSSQSANTLLPPCLPACLQ